MLYCFSTTFTTSNGVRQGGILSPLFFNVYMNKLSSALNDAKVGCITNGVYMNHLMYADDLVLIAPSVRALQVLLSYCDSFAKDNDVKYNAKKTVCMFVRPKELKSHYLLLKNGRDINGIQQYSISICLILCLIMVVIHHRKLILL